MSSLIVIRIVPPAPVAAAPAGSTPPTFADYLANSGGLQIAAFDVSYSSPTSGTAVGSAVYQAPNPAPQTSPTANPPAGFIPTPATYVAGTGVIQQLDVEPAVFALGVEIESAFYQFESVATAVIEFTPASGATIFENLRLVATWVTGGGQAISITQDYYNVPLAAGPIPDPNTFITTSGGTTVDAWSNLAPSLYLTLPAPAAP